MEQDTRRKAGFDAPHEVNRELTSEELTAIELPSIIEYRNRIGMVNHGILFEVNELGLVIFDRFDALKEHTRSSGFGYAQDLMVRASWIRLRIDHVVTPIDICVDWIDPLMRHMQDMFAADPSLARVFAMDIGYQAHIDYVNLITRKVDDKKKGKKS